MSANKGAALVTGSSSGIGAIYADRLAKRGYDLILVARNKGRLDELRTRLVKETGRNVQSVPADLNDAADLGRIEEILKKDVSINMLVNNAGIGAVTPLLKSDISKMDEIIALNIGALTHLTYAAAPAFVERGAGTFINIASVVGITPETLNGVYGATKAYVIALSQSLQHELGDKGIRIQAVLPGATATEFWDLAGFPYQNMPQNIVMTAEDMVDAALVGLDQGEIITIPALPDLGEWNTYETARQAMASRLSNAVPAARYGIALSQAH